MYITQGLHRHLQGRPNETAIRFMGRSTTYAEFSNRVARLAGALKKIGVTSGERVAMLSVNSQRYIEYYQAVPWADAVLNPVNIRWSAAEIVYSLDDSETAVLIVDDTFLELGKKIIKEAKTLRTIIYAGDRETPPGMLSYEALILENEPIEDCYRLGEALLGVFYTGGTTGFPKGVMLSHNNLGFSSLAVLQSGSYAADTIFLHVMPMFHLADFAAMTALFLTGGKHVVLPGFMPKLVLETIATEQVNEVLLAPTMIQMLLDYRDTHPEAAALDLSSLRKVGYGASPITPTLLNRARQAFPSAGFSQGYGMTELSPLATALGPEYHTEKYERNGKMYSAGKPGVCVEVRIVDPDDNEVPRGVSGEIVVRGPNVMMGYWKQPEATAKAIRNGWMHTGDGGYMDEDGFIYVRDRIKDMIVSGGENIYSAEVETAIASHPAVAQVAVIAVPSEKWGESVHAVIVLNADGHATEEEIVAHCRERIAGYKCPRSVEFREALPMTSVGKIQKNTLRAPFWENQDRAVG